MFDRCLYFNINTLTRTVNRIWEQAFQPLGLSPAHAYLLMAVLKEPGLSQKRLAELLDLAPSTVTRFVDALAGRELLVRAQNPADGRESVVHPSAKAMVLQKPLRETGERLFQLMQSHLGGAEMGAFVDEMKQTYRKLQAL